MKVEISFEAKRKCGFRKPAKDGVGIYLVGSGQGEGCERLPFPLHVCPCCGGGIRPGRGFHWIDPTVLLDFGVKPACTALHDDFGFQDDPRHRHGECYVCNPHSVGPKAGLLWIGEQHYKTPGDFLREAQAMGISRKIAALPNNFEVGKDVVYLGHRKATREIGEDGEMVWQAGLIMAFRPRAVELVIDDPDNVPDKAIEIAKRVGVDKCRIIKVMHDEEESESEWDE